MSSYDWQALWNALIDDPVADHLILCSHLVGWLTPWMIYFVLGYGMTWVDFEPETRRTMRRILLPAVWIAALFVSQFAMRWGEWIWNSNHRGERLTEDQVFQFADGPNMFAEWLFLGSIIVAVTYSATRNTGLPREARTPKFQRTPATG